MTELWHNSLSYRLWQGFLALCRASFAGGLLRKLRQSAFAVGVRQRLVSPPAAQGSLLARWEAAWNRLLWRLGQRLSPLLESSRAVASVRKIARAVRESLLLGWLFSGGLTTALLTVLGLFGVIDWLLRDVLSVPVVSSIWDEALLLLGLLLTLCRPLRSKQPLPSRVNALSLPLLQFLFISAALFFVTFREAPSVTLTGLRATCQGILWFPILLRLLRDARDLRRLYGCMVLCAFVISLHGIYQYIVAAPMPPEWVDAGEQAVRTRAYSIFGSPNILGDFMVLLAPMTLALACRADKPLKKLVFLGMTACMLAACLFTMSRGAWVGLLAAAFVYALLADRRLLLLAIVASVLALALPFVSSRLLYLLSPSYAASAALGGRDLRWQTAFGYLAASGRSWLGLGFGRFGGAVAMQNPIRSDWSYFYVDNYYVKIAAENGWIGLISFGILLLSLLLGGLKSWACVQKTRHMPLVAGMLAGLCGVLVHCYFENIFEEPYMQVWFWCVAAMLIFFGSQRSMSESQTQT